MVPTVRQTRQMRLNFVLLLPPSEGKAEGGRPGTKWRPKSGTFGLKLGARRGEVAAALAAEGGGNAALLGVGGRHLKRAQAANRGVVGALTLPAAERYTGVVWEHLDLAGMTAAQRERALARIIVLSGLTGASLASDPVPDYRLKMGVRPPGFSGTLARWWRDAVSDAVNDYARGCIVIDLLPTEHRAAYSPDPFLDVDHVIVDLVTSNGRAGGHDAKAAKGRLARHLLLTTPMIASRKGLMTAIEKFSDGAFRVVTKVN